MTPLKNIRVALIPAYQPSAFLTDLVKQLHHLNFTIIVVDDGSGEQYCETFEGCLPYALVLHHDKNAGKGHALKTGLHEIYIRYGTDCVIVTVDADGQHRAEDASAIINIAEQNPSALILGSRVLEKQAPLRSRFGNTATQWVYRLCTGYPIHDTQTGLRAFTGDLIPMLIEIPGERYEYEMNMLLQFAHDKRKIVEYPIETIYIDNNAASHFDTVKDSVRIYKEILKFSASSFLGFLVDYAAYSLLLWTTGNLLVSNILARVISACVNFTVNRRYVFKSSNHLLKDALKYFALAAAILAGNTCLLGFFVSVCGIHKMPAKILTEICFFLLSWLVQRLFVFRKKNRR